jgi:hypothetical protein
MHSDTMECFYEIHLGDSVLSDEALRILDLYSFRYRYDDTLKLSYSDSTIEQLLHSFFSLGYTQMKYRQCDYHNYECGNWLRFDPYDSH